MLGDLRIENFSLYILEGLKNSGLVHPNQPRVAGHIGGEDSGKTAGLAHFSSPAAKRKPDSSSSRCSGFRK